MGQGAGTARSKGQGLGVSQKSSGVGHKGKAVCVRGELDMGAGTRRYRSGR